MGRMDADLDLGDGVRLRLLTDHREYSTRAGLFDGFPDDVRWQWMAITPAELAGVRYVDYDYWVELSGGSRLAADAAPRIRAGVAPFGVSSDWALGMAREVARGARFPPLILVTTGPGGGLVVLEGHARLTAYMLARDRLPPELEVLVGSSPAMTRWAALDSRSATGERDHEPTESGPLKRLASLRPCRSGSCTSQRRSHSSGGDSSGCAGRRAASYCPRR